MSAETPRTRFLKRNSALLSERSSWDAHWQDIASYIAPRRYRLDKSDRNRGTKRGEDILNNTATRALRTLKAGMVSGLTSRSRPWLRLTVPGDKALDKRANVRAWLDDCVLRMLQVFAQSNIYDRLQNVYSDLAAYGTSLLIVEADEEDVVRGYVDPLGQYSLATSARQRVNAAYRERSFTVAQLIERFTLERVSPRVRDMARGGHLDQWVDVLHVIEPNVSYVEGALGPRGKRYASVWMEKGGGDEHQGFLHMGGYDDLPFMAPRWDVASEDVYGSLCPGMEALGDVKALQAYELDKARIIQKLHEPPMQGPPELMGHQVSILPGGYTAVPANNASQRLGPALEVRADALPALGGELREHERRINDTFYASIWLMVANGQHDPKKTATEIAALQDEKMQQLGPVIERLGDELLDPLVDFTFDTMMRRGLLPPPPKELAGVDLRVDYISILAQAQKMTATVGIERLAGFVGNVAAVREDVLDKVDFDEAVDAYADALGVPTRIVKDTEEAQAVREERAAQARAQAAAETANTMAQGAATLAKADLDSNNALTGLLGSVGAPTGVV